MAKQIIDLYCGAGGFSLGAHLAGFKPVLCLDKDEILTYSFRTNFPHSRLETIDLSKLSPEDLLSLAGLKPNQLAGIVGGPPCQGFSFIGKREPKDPRSQHIFRFFEFVGHAKPAFFVMENVLGLVSNAFVGVLNAGLDLVSRHYQIIGPLKLNAVHYGAATSRRRVFVIGYRPDCLNQLTEDDITSAKVARTMTVYDALHDLPPLQSAFLNGDGDYWAKYDREPDPGKRGSYARRARRIPPSELSIKRIRKALRCGEVAGFQATNHTQKVVERFAKVAPGKSDDVSRCPRLKWDGHCSTLRAGTGKDRGSYQSIRPIHPDEDRVITVREAARLQGFPDWYQFHPTKWHSFRMIGNSVPPYLSEAILSLIAERMTV